MLRIYEKNTNKKKSKLINERFRTFVSISHLIIASPLVGEDARRAGEGDAGSTSPGLRPPSPCLGRETRKLLSRNFVVNKGFTLIELLVVVAIIGLLATIIATGFTSTTLKGRDTRRVSDLKQVKSGLDLFFADAAGYPDDSDWVAGNVISCNGQTILRIPEDPVQSTLGYEYDYTASGPNRTGCGTTVRGDYTVEFYLETQANYYVMDSNGIFFTSNSGQPGTPVNIDELL